MKPFSLSILISVLLISSFSSAQTFQTGVKIDAERLTTSPCKFPSSSFQVRTAYLTGTDYFLDDLALEARLGYNWEDFYSGAEAGLFSKFYYKDVYAIGGIVYHHINKKDPEWIDQIYFSTESDLFMPALGLGFNPGRHFAVELMLQHGLNKKIGYYYKQPLTFDDLYHPFSEVFPDVNLKWIVRIGMSYNFSL